MASIPQVLDDGSVTQAKSIKYMQFAAELWSRAQVQSAKIKMLGSDMVDLQGDLQSFDRIDKRSFTRKTKSVEATPQNEQTYDRRILFTETLHDAFQVDLDDIVNSKHDIISSGERQMEHAAARECDKKVLSAIVNPVFVDEGGRKSKADPSTNAGTNVLTSFSTDLEKRYQVNCFRLIDSASSDKDLISAVALERVLYIFAERDALEDEGGRLCATLTPELQRILRTDPNFLNAEQVILPSPNVSTPWRHFDYRGITFIPTSKSVLPEIDASAGILGLGSDKKIITLDGTGGTSRTAASGSGSSAVAARENPLDTDTLRESKSKPTGTKSAVTVTDSDKSTTEVLLGAKLVEVGGKGDLAYFWFSNAIKFASRSDLSFMKRADRADYSEAKQTYMRINIGSLLIDSDYAMAVVVKGKDA